MAGNKELRAALDEAIALREPDAYYAQLDALRVAHGHCIRIISRHGNYNCFAYAFGISDHDDFLSLAMELNDAHLMKSDFVLAALKAGSIAPSVQSAGAVALYFKDGELSHAAKIASVGDRIHAVSKWGHSELHQHELWEVPASYGDEVEYVTGDPEKRLDQLYEHYGFAAE